MKRIIFHSIAPGFLIAWCFVFLSGCKDPILEEDLLLLNQDTINLGHIDTLTILAKTLADEPPITSDVQIGCMGNMDDLWFGKTVAGIYAQCRLSTNNVSFPDNVTVDSVVLALKYSGKYGRFDQHQVVSVFELSESMNPDQQYLANETFGVNAMPIGSLSHYVPSADSAVVDSVKQAPQMRIRLSNEIGNRILNADSAQLADNTAFLQLFKGFYVAPNSLSPGNGLAYFDLFNSASKITIYYRDTVRHTFDMGISSACATVNHFDHYQSGFPVKQHITNPMPGGDSLLLLQSAGGSKVEIQIPYLDSLPQNIAINKAELIISVRPDETTGDSLYSAPLAISLKRLTEDGSIEALDDYTFSVSLFDGTRRTETVNGTTVTRYHFNITRYLQRMVSHSLTNNGYILENYSKGINSERVLISNRKDSDYRIQLKITYTKI